MPLARAFRSRPRAAALHGRPAAREPARRPARLARNDPGTRVLPPNTAHQRPGGRVTGTTPGCDALRSTCPVLTQYRGASRKARAAGPTRSAPVATSRLVGSDELLQHVDVVGRQPALLERRATGALNSAEQWGCPEMLDQRDRRDRPWRHRVRQGPLPVGSILARRLRGCICRTGGISQERRGKVAGCCSQLGRRGKRVETAVFGTFDDKQIEQPDDSCLAQPGELREHLSGERWLIEADDQNLHGAHQVLTRARIRAYSSSVTTPAARSRCSASTVADDSAPAAPRAGRGGCEAA